MNKAFSSVLEKVKGQFMPQVDNKLRMTMDGRIAAPHAGEYTVFDANDELVSLPADLVLDLPVYSILKTIDNVVPGDVIRTGDDKKYTYQRVDAIVDGKIKTSTYGGNTRTITPIKDFFMGQKTVRVAINLFGNCFGNGSGDGAQQFNPMMLLALKDGDSKMSDLLPFFLMNQGQQFNPMMLLALKGDDSSDFFEMMLMQNLMQGKNIFSMFSNPVTPAE